MTPLLMMTSGLPNTTWKRSDDDDGDDQTSHASDVMDDDVTYLLWMIVPPVLLVLGCYGNVMTMAVMRGLRASESTGCLSVYFTALAVSDLVVVCTAFVWFWPEGAFGAPVVHSHDLSCTILYFLIYTSSLASAWFLVAMTCQRLTSVVLPHRVSVLCTVRRGKIITAAIVTIACLANIHFFFHYHVEHVDQGYKLCVSYDIATSVFFVVDIFLGSLIPFVLLITANAVLIYRIMRSIHTARAMTAKDDRRRSRSAQVPSMAVTLVLTSAAFLALTLPDCMSTWHFGLIGYFEVGTEDNRLSDTSAVVQVICILMRMSNSAVNFYIYILSGAKFRREAKRCLCSCFKRQQTGK